MSITTKEVALYITPFDGDGDYFTAYCGPLSHRVEEKIHQAIIEFDVVYVSDTKVEFLMEDAYGEWVVLS